MSRDLLIKILHINIRRVENRSVVYHNRNIICDKKKIVSNQIRYSRN